jgi:hypothetical protein
MSQETRELAMVLHDRFRETSRLQELKHKAVGYLFKLFEDTLNEIRRDLAGLGGDSGVVKFYRSPEDNYIVLKIGNALTTVYAMEKVGLCPVQMEGSSGLCSRVIVFNGDYRNLEVEDEDQLSAIEEDSLFIFSEGASSTNVLLFHIVHPVGLHATDWGRFVLLTLTALTQKSDSHYSPMLDQIINRH